jgi:phosphopentomutase
VARSHGYTTAAFFSKAKFDALQQPGTVDYSQAPGGWFGRWSSRKTAADVRAYLEKARPNVLFVHLPDPDRAGHSDGWMTEAYGRAVLSADGALRDVIDAAGTAFGAGNFSVLVTADHGGHGNDHGSDDPRDVTIPWIAWGRGIRSGQLSDVSIHTVDTAATVLWLLGAREPEEWQGAPVTQAFVPASAATN